MKRRGAPYGAPAEGNNGRAVQPLPYKLYCGWIRPFLTA